MFPEGSTVHQHTVSQIPPDTIQTAFKKISQDCIFKAHEILKQEWARVTK